MGCLLIRQITILFYVTLDLPDSLDYLPLLIRRERRVLAIYITIIRKKLPVALEI